VGNLEREVVGGETANNWPTTSNPKATKAALKRSITFSTLDNSTEISQVVVVN
jgi:hypothetical protein